MNRRVIWATTLSFCIALVMVSCAGMQTTKPTEANFKAPVIKLDSFEVPQYDGWWYYAKAVAPTKGEAGDHGAPLPMSFLFSVQNPNPYPVLLEGVKFTVVFDKEFEFVTVHSTDSNWIPANKTDQVRVSTMIMPRQAVMTLLVVSGYKLKEKGWSPWEALERWWKGVPEYTVPVTVKEGAFMFKADGLVKVLPFEATFP
jgi:hypothetical protein